MPATSVSPGSLANSVSREAGGSYLSDLSPCERRGPSHWSCTVPGGSGAARYRVEMRGSKCWRAVIRSGGGEGGFPSRAEGCVRVRDQIARFPL